MPLAAVRAAPLCKWAGVKYSETLHSLCRKPKHLPHGKVDNGQSYSDNDY